MHASGKCPTVLSSVLSKWPRGICKSWSAVLQEGGQSCHTLTGPPLRMLPPTNSRPASFGCSGSLHHSCHVMLSGTSSLLLEDQSMLPPTAYAHICQGKLATCVHLWL